MSTYDNAPPPPDWSPEPHYCADLGFLEAGMSRIEEIPPLVVLGEN